MERNEMLKLVKLNSKEFDFVIIGGGATGIGIALEASSRGYAVVLLEKSDFAKSTSSKSTKLVHGGVRYLAQGELGLVREAVVERGRLVANAPHLVRGQTFLIPANGILDEVKYTVGLTLYDLLAGKRSLGRSKRISKSEAVHRIPNVKPSEVSAGVEYQDGQFDDTRLAINSLQSAVEMGAVVINYCGVTGLLKNDNGQICGVKARDEESKELFEIKGKQIVNATGVFADDILQMDAPNMERTIAPSQGVHLVVDKLFLPGKDAIMIPKTTDGRVLFMLPWYDKVIVGTTDTPIKQESLEPVALEQEIQFILNTVSQYLINPPKRSDVLSVFAGLRPLAAPDGKGKKTKELSRSHKIFETNSGLLTLVGGKWTTYRKMGEDLVSRTEEKLGWKPTLSQTKNLKIHGYVKEVNHKSALAFYGSDEASILKLAEKDAPNGLISESLQVLKAQVVWAVKHEMARTVEDFLARRTRCQLLDAKESISMAKEVAIIMAIELGKDHAWEINQVKDYETVTANYIL